MKSTFISVMILACLVLTSAAQTQPASDTGSVCGQAISHLEACIDVLCEEAEWSATPACADREPLSHISADACAEGVAAEAAIVAATPCPHLLQQLGLPVLQTSPTEAQGSAPDDRPCGVDTYRDAAGTQLDSRYRFLYEAAPEGCGALPWMGAGCPTSARVFLGTSDILYRRDVFLYDIQQRLARTEQFDGLGHMIETVEHDPGGVRITIPEGPEATGPSLTPPTENTEPVFDDRGRLQHITVDGRLFQLLYDCDPISGSNHD